MTKERKILLNYLLKEYKNQLNERKIQFKKSNKRVTLSIQSNRDNRDEAFTQLNIYIWNLNPNNYKALWGSSSYSNGKFQQIILSIIKKYEKSAYLNGDSQPKKSYNGYGRILTVFFRQPSLIDIQKVANNIFVQLQHRCFRTESL